jgi:hypothetical protein
MGYKKIELEEMALDAIDENKLVNTKEVISYLPCSTATFYNWKLEQLESIKKALNDNRVSIKAKLRKNWLASDNATVNIALYKLLATEDELKALNGESKQELSVRSNSGFKMKWTQKKSD